MNIVIDAGNSYSKIGWFSGTDLIKLEVRLSFSEMIEKIKSEMPSQIIFSSVGASFEVFKDALGTGAEIYNLNGSTPIPIVNKYATPQTLGADRIAACVGANYLYPDRDLLVIDMGTCITYDFVSSSNELKGGSISPGLRMRFKAMHTFTERLPLVEPDIDALLTGTNTIACMQSGVMNGLLAEIEGIINRYRHTYPQLCVVICGGDASFFDKKLKGAIFTVPELVLIGLNRILLYNVALQ